MAEKPHLTHIDRPLSEEERRQAAVIREGARQEFPPKHAQRAVAPSGIPRRIHEARIQRKMTRYELGQIAKVPSTVVRAIEQGGDVPFSQFHAVVEALGLNIELVDQT